MTFDEVQMARMVLQPGEVIVLRMQARLPRDAHQSLRDYVQRVVGTDVPILILDGGIDIATLCHASGGTLRV